MLENMSARLLPECPEPVARAAPHGSISCVSPQAGGAFASHGCVDIQREEQAFVGASWKSAYSSSMTHPCPQ